jgi:hypothetical protein
MATVTTGIHGAGVLDFVAGWYVKAARYLTAEINPFGQIIERAAPGRKKFKDVRFGKGEAAMNDMFLDAAEVEVKSRRAVRCAFVSTNSITQGEQVGVLWSWLLSQGLHIQFAHRTFQWMNEAPGKAAVHCVIVGFGCESIEPRRLFEYETLDGEPHEIAAKNINPYLADAVDVLISRRDRPICEAPEINKGSEATDFGHLFLEPNEKASLVASTPNASRWLRRVCGGEELINGVERWCLWLVGAGPEELRRMPEVLERVERVRKGRESSGKARTKEWAAQPSLFSENRQPDTAYLAVPKVSSERRNYLPIAHLTPEIIATGSLQVLPNATVFHFGVLSSSMHMAWLRYTCGRMKSDYQYSNSIVYNNFPWPEIAWPFDSGRWRGLRSG